MARNIVKNITTKTTINLCRKIFATFRIPKYFVQDNAKTFTTTEFKIFLKVNRITQKLTASYNPSTNGQAERFVQILKNSLRHMRSNPSNVHIYYYNKYLYNIKTQVMPQQENHQN